MIHLSVPGAGYPGDLIFYTNLLYKYLKMSCYIIIRRHDWNRERKKR